MIPTIVTERLILRAPTMDDLPRIHDYMSQERSHFVGGPFDELGCWNMLRSIAGHWYFRGFGMWAIADKSDNRLMGLAGFLHHIDWPEIEIGWQLHHEAEGKGIAFEAVSAARAYGAKHFSLTGVASFIDPKNTRSANLATRLRAVQDGFVEVRGNTVRLFRHPTEELTA